jgi:subtilase family serine protease
MDYFLPVSLLCWFYFLSNVICDDIHNRPWTSQEYESNMSLMEEQIIRNDFFCVNRSNRMEFHEVVIAIQQKNLPLIQQMVLDRANPLNPSYQQWMTFNEIGELVENLEAYSRVIDWLNAYNLTPSWHSTYHEYVKVNSTIETLEQMLSTEFYACHDHSRSSNLTFRRSFRYSIPTILIDDTHAIFHTSQVPPRYEPSFQIPSNSWKLGNTQNVTISFLNNLYQISSNIAESSFNQSSYQMSNEYFSQSDLQQFQQTYQLTVQPAISIGGHDTSTCTTTTCSEGNLDIQYMMGIAQKAATIFWYVASDTGDPFVSWITTVSSLDNPPQSNSISWNALEMFISDAVLTSWEAEAMKLSGRGVTISTASGDHGAPNSYYNECLCVGTVSVLFIYHYICDFFLITSYNRAPQTFRKRMMGTTLISRHRANGLLLLEVQWVQKVVRQKSHVKAPKEELLRQEVDSQKKFCNLPINQMLSINI